MDDLDEIVQQCRDEGTFKEPTSYPPLVIQDPDTGKKSLLISPYLTYKVEGMSPLDSRKLVGDVVERCIAQKGYYRCASCMSVHDQCANPDCCSINALFK